AGWSCQPRDFLLPNRWAVPVCECRSSCARFGLPDKRISQLFCQLASLAGGLKARRVARVQKRNSRGDSMLSRPSAPETKILLPFYRISGYHYQVPLPSEGRFAIVTNAGSGMRWMLAARATSAALADGESVWSWHPWAGAKCAGDDPRATVTKRSWTPGRA